MPKVKCLLVDDEPLAIDVLESYIEMMENFEVVGKCKNAIDALNTMQRTKIDLVFLDIQMPRLTGIELLKTMSSPPKVILTTAYKQYAIDGYELNVLDYLLKPISFERFLVAINKFREVSVEKQNIESNDFSESYSDAFLYVKADRKMQKIFLKDILYIEGLKDYVKIKTIDRMFITHQTMTYFEEKLPDGKFLRVHRSFIAAIDKITAISNTQLEINNEKLPIGRLYKMEVMKLFQK